MPVIRAIVTLCLFALLALPCRAEDAPESGPAQQHTGVLPYTRIGVVPFFDDSRLHNGAEQFTQVLLGRLGAQIDGVTFVLADPHDIGLKSGPLQPNEARALGAKLDVQALLDGVFSGVDIVGGTWPSLGNDLPQASGDARWRLLDAASGMLVQDGRVGRDEPKLYPKRVRNSEDLVRRVMKDLAGEIAAALADGGRVPADDETRAAAGDKPQGSAEGEAK